MIGTYRLSRFFLIAVFLGAISPALAAVSGQIGPYRLEISTEPAVIPVGRARLRIDLKDAAGRPVEGAEIRSLVQMPQMPMGEKELSAQPLSGQPGSYTMEASFGMAGSYGANISIRGPLGEASGRITLETGQDTGQPASGFSFPSALPWILGAALALAGAFALFRFRQTANLRLTRGTVSGILLIVVTLVASRWAVNQWRRPGSMTPFEAQSMEMNTPAPPGVAMVTLADVDRGPIDSTVWYPGQAVAFNEQDVIVRTEGWLSWMPFYVGQQVKPDEVVAHLDISDLQALADLDRMRAELLGKREALEGAQAEITAAREERISAEADLAGKQSMIAEAEAMVTAMEADRQFWQQQNARNKTLLDKGALSLEEYQREAAMTANAIAKVQQAQTRLEQTRSEIRSAQAMVRRAEALVTASERKRRQMESDLKAAEAAVRAAQSRAGMEHTGEVRENANHSHVEIRAHLGGVVTERRTNLGEHVSSGQSILRIAQTDSIRLQANVAESDLARIRLGNRVVVRGRDSGIEPFITRVTSIAPSVDPATRTGLVEAVAPNRDGRFLPGVSIGLDISAGKSEDAVRVPVAAVKVRPRTGEGLLTAGSTNFVWVAQEGGSNNQYVVSPLEVETGVSDGVYVQILSGLQPGQKVVASGSDYLKQGDTVSARTRIEDAR